jgi:hypothetical protein
MTPGDVPTGGASVVVPSSAAASPWPPTMTGELQIMADPPSGSATGDPHVKSSCTHSAELWQSCTERVGHGSGWHLTKSAAPGATRTPQQTSPGTHVVDDVHITVGRLVSAAVLTWPGDSHQDPNGAAIASNESVKRRAISATVLPTRGAVFLHARAIKRCGELLKEIPRECGGQSSGQGTASQHRCSGRRIHSEDRRTTDKSFPRSDIPPPCSR